MGVSGLGCKYPSVELGEQFEPTSLISDLCACLVLIVMITVLVSIFISKTLQLTFLLTADACLS